MQHSFTSDFTHNLTGNEAIGILAVGRHSAMLDFTYDTRLVPPKVGEKEHLVARFLVLTGQRTAEGEMITQLCTKPVDGTFDYAALSYCWGDSLATKTICCNSQKISVSEHLFAALLRIEARSWFDSMLWVDRIYINQEDVEEKEFQVSRMSTIYSNAEEVFIWLGEEDEETPVAFEVLKRLKRFHLSLPNRQENWFEDAIRAGPKHGLAPPVTPFTRHPWWCLISLLHRPWFRRIWIVQEVAVSRKATVTCGRHSMDWDGFHISISTMAYLLSGLGSEFNLEVVPLVASFPAAIEASRKSVTDSEKKTLLTLLIDHHLFEAKDPRDKIYALFGIAADTSLEGLDIKYNVDARDLYWQVAEVLIKKSKNLDVLRGIRHDSPRSCARNYLSDLPSWVTDWSNAPRSTVLWQPDPDDLHGPFSAAGPSLCSPRFCGDCRCEELYLRGLVFDTIIDVGEVYDQHLPYIYERPTHTSSLDNTLIRIKTCLTWEKAGKVRKQSQYVNGEDMWSAYLRTLSGGSLATVPRSIWASYLYDTWLFSLPAYLYAQGFTKLAKVVHIILAFFGILTIFIPLMTICGEYLGIQSSRFWSFRAMARSEIGYIALVPGLTQHGDKIVLLEGGTLPFILRPRRDWKWEIIGEAYVHGIMYGEAWKEESCGEICLI